MNEHVELYRPPRRFGWAVTVWRETVDGRRQALQWDTGTELWVDVTPGADVEPTFYFSDEVLDQLAQHWLQLKPRPQPDPDAVRVLQDSLGDHRDNALFLRQTVNKLIDLAWRPMIKEQEARRREGKP